MSDGPQNPYEDLTEELNRRFEEWRAAEPWVLSPQCVAWSGEFLKLVDEAQRRFCELLMRKYRTPPDFDSIYRRKAELDLKLFTSHHDRP